MRYTVKYLRYVLLGVIGIIMCIGWAVGGLSLIVGFVGSLAESEVGYLILVPVGLFCGFLGFTAFDIINHLVDKWRL